MIGFELIKNDIKRIIEKQLDRVGILYRLHSRIKTIDSILEKDKRKGYSKSNTEVMQDVIGFRIVTYFEEDVRLIAEYFKNYFKQEDFKYDSPKDNEFNPLRKNLVCRLEGSNLKDFEAVKKRNIETLSFLDSTFEIQFRTTLSEGWHEVEHNMRYKCKEEWKDLQKESRALNGIYATLETSDYTLNSLFEKIAYKQYKCKDYQGMLRNKFRLRFLLDDISDELKQIISNNDSIAKEIYKIDRGDFMSKLINSDLRFPITFNNICFLCNFLYLKNEEITSLTPSILSDDFKCLFPNT
ncbi:hypothetical protein [Dysgonomonas mossii]|uniref:hypothetical protein n=1 Tax=Dysgonomonas mossii TaxID=163665 RepID=UPI00399522E8